LSPLGKAVRGNPKPWQPRSGYLAGSPLVKGNHKPWQQCPGYLACSPLVRGKPTENPESILYRPFLFFNGRYVIRFLFDHCYPVIVVFVFYSLVLFLVLLLLVVLLRQHGMESRLSSRRTMFAFGDTPKWIDVLVTMIYLRICLKLKDVGYLCHDL